ERTPFDDEKRVGGMWAPGLTWIEEANYARVCEQTAIAILGQPSEPVDIGHVDARRLDRLDQRIGKPLRQLVERHQLVGRVVAPDCRMPPRVTERNTLQRQSARPDRRKMLEQAFKQAPGR